MISVSNKELARMGMADISVRAVEFDKPVGERGLHSGLKPVSWKCTITSLNGSSPMVVACRADPDEAENDAKERFVAIFGSKRKPGDPAPPPFVEDKTPPPKPRAAAKPKPVAAVPVEDDELDDLI